jgi:hypothetical protein
MLFYVPPLPTSPTLPTNLKSDVFVMKYLIEKDLTYGCLYEGDVNQPNVKAYISS